MLTSIRAAFRIRIPPLRERPEDIAPLARALVARDAARYGGYATPPSLAPALVRRLEHEAWMGNVRELEGAMRRIVVDACGDPVLEVRLLDDALEDLASPDGDDHRPARRDARADEPMDIEAALRDGVSKAEAARQLGISRATLYRRRSRAQADHPADVHADAAPCEDGPHPAAMPSATEAIYPSPPTMSHALSHETQPPVS